MFFPFFSLPLIQYTPQWLVSNISVKRCPKIFIFIKITCHWCDKIRLCSKLINRPTSKTNNIMCSIIILFCSYFIIYYQRLHITSILSCMWKRKRGVIIIRDFTKMISFVVPPPSHIILYIVHFLRLDFRTLKNPDFT